MSRISTVSTVATSAQLPLASPLYVRLRQGWVVCMSADGIGPFENDGALDLCDELQGASPDDAA